MAAVDDLKAAVSNLVQAATDEINAIVAKLANSGGADGSVSAADVQDAVTSINNVTSQLQAETALLTSAPPPASTGSSSGSSLPPPPA